MSMLCILPRKVNLTNPNNWRIINLKNFTRKSIYIMINVQLQNIIKTNFYPNQFSIIPHIDCQDAVTQEKNVGRFHQPC